MLSPGQQLTIQKILFLALSVFTGSASNVFASGEVIQSKSRAMNREITEEKLRALGKIESPYKACEALLLVDSETYEKNEVSWRNLKLDASMAAPIEIVPSTSVFRSFNGAPAAKPGSMATDEFLKKVGEQAVSDLETGLEQYRDLQRCVKAGSKSALCEVLEAGFRFGIEAQASALRATLAQMAIATPADAARADVVGDISAFMNPELSVRKAGVFGVGSQRSLSATESAVARRELRLVLEKAKRDYAAMVDSKISDAKLIGIAAETERVRLTSSHAKTAAIQYRFDEHRANMAADYYRILSSSPQLAYTTDAKIGGDALVGVLTKMISDAEVQLKKTKEALAADPMMFAGYTGVIERILTEEARVNRGKPKHCGLAAALFNESIAIKTGRELQVLAALITAPIAVGATGPKIAQVLSGGRVALSAAAAGQWAVDSGIGGGLLASVSDYQRGKSAELEVRTGVVKSETARSEIASGSVAPVMAVTNAVGGKALVGGVAGLVGRQIAARGAGKLPPVIARSEGTVLKSKVLDPERLKRSVITANVRDSKKSLQNLEDGIYVFGIDTRGNIAVLPRNLDPGGRLESESLFVGSHLGIQSYLKHATGRDPEFVAMGEFVQRNGRTFMAGNGAGTFKSGTENLEYGIERLKEKGLPIDGRTQIRDYSKEVFEDPHDLVNVQVPIELRVQRDPVLRAGHAEAAKVMRAIDPLGIPDKDAFFERALAMDGVDTTTAYHAASLYGRWMHPQEGTPYVYDAIRDRIGPEQMNQVLGLIKKMTTEAAAPKN